MGSTTLHLRAIALLFIRGVSAANSLEPASAQGRFVDTMAARLSVFYVDGRACDGVCGSLTGGKECAEEDSPGSCP